MKSRSRETLPAPFDVHKLRAEFPILAQEVHGHPLVYLDNAATAQKPHAVIDALRAYYETDNANVHRAAHTLSDRATQAYEAARIKAQKFLNANCLREIIFTRGTTESINLVASSYGRKHLQAGDEVILTELEHHSNIVPWQLICQERGARLRVLPINDAGELKLEELEKLLTPRTRMLAVAHVSNALGTINPLKRIIEIAHRHKVPVLVDGAQAAPHLRIDVQDLDCDFYAFSGHKVYGPTGIGVLYGKPEHLELMPPYQGGGDMIHSVSFARTTYNELPYKFEAGTPNIAGAIGLGAALDFITEVGRSAIAEHEHQLLEYATAQMSAIPGVRLIGTAHDKAAVLSFVVQDPPLAALDIGTRLDLDGIAIRTGHHCCEPLMDRFGIAGTARASLALYNTIEEIDVFVAALTRIVKEAARKKTATVALPNKEPVYPGPSAESPEAAADELAELFGYFDDWTDRYQQIIEMGSKLSPVPAEYRTEENRVRGCQSTVFMNLRKRPGSGDVIEFLADSDADIVCGLIALLQRIYSGQHAARVAAFDMPGFFKRIGLDQNLSMGRRNGLADMVACIRTFAAGLAAASQ
jgi:cysteine desulfurase/selenocysteine lyase